MISQKYIDDGRSNFSLNDLQIRLRDQVAEKVAAGVYKFENTDCCLCGDSKTELLAEKDRYGLKLPVVICKECGLIFTNPRMDQKSYARFYDSEYRELYHGYNAPYADLFNHGVRRGKQIARFLLEAGIDIRQIRMLEVGCGAGGILAHFREQYGCEVAGCDFGSEGVRFGVENHNIPLQEGDLSTITLQWKPDIIIYSHVFEHILDLNKECEKIKACLNENGSVYIEVPSVKNIRKNYEWDFLSFLQNAHTYHFTLRTLQDVMGRNGFALQAGNEFARALFVKSALPVDIENDYYDVMRFLKNTEQLRPFYYNLVSTKIFAIKLLKNTEQLRPFCYNLVSPKIFAIKLLKKFGLYSLVRRLLGKT